MAVWSRYVFLKCYILYTRNFDFDSLTSYIFKCCQYWVSFYFNLYNKVLYYELSSHTCAFPGKRKDGVVLPDLWPKTSATECMLVHNSVWLCKVYMRLSVVYDLTDLSWNPLFTSTTSGQDKEGGNSELQRNRVRKEEKQENKTGRHMWSCKEEVHRFTGLQAEIHTDQNILASTHVWWENIPSCILLYLFKINKHKI